MKKLTSRAPWFFISPYLILTVFFFIYPFLDAIFLAFHQTNGPKSKIFVGWKNFAFVLSDSDFHTAFWNTTIYALASLCLQLPLSLGLALLLNSKKDRLKEVFRLILFSPHLVGQVFVGIIFSLLFMTRHGLFNRFLQKMIFWGLDQEWLSNPSLVMPALIIVSMWMYVGFNMIYFLAALQNVDQELTEAALIDGANSWQSFWAVTVPAIKPVAIFVVIMSTIGSYQLFEMPYSMLQGYGPKDAGLTIVGYLYRTAFETGDLGTGAAIGWILALIIFIFSMAQMAIARSVETE